MAKGKFTRSRKDGDGDIVKKFSRALQEDETVPLPRPTANPLDVHDDPKSPDQDRSMPQCDFESFQDLDSLPELNFPELAALDLDSDDSEYKAMFEPIPPSQEETDPQPRAEEKAPPVRKKRPRASGFRPASQKKALVILSSFLVLILISIGGFLLYAHFSDPYDHRILNGVYVAGVHVGSMTRSQAEQAVSAAADNIFGHEDMVIHLPEQDLILPPAATRISLRVDDAVRAAYNYGRTGSEQEQKDAYTASLTETLEIDLRPFLSADETYIRRELEGYADTHSSSYIPSSYALEGEQPPLDFENFNEKNTPQTLLLILGNPGFHLDIPQAVENIMAAYGRMDMAPTLQLQAGNGAPDLLDLNRVFEEYHIDPVNSTMDKENYDVIPGSYGYTFDLQAARRLLKEAHYGDTVRIPMEYVTPEIMDDQVYFQDVLSTVETPHKDNKPRNVNLTLACQAINGIVLNPGDEFSYNATLGQRTADKGYQAAPAYSGDKLVDSLGGGICQVSSTLYLSCMLADLEITDRINHGFLPTYIDPGMDATVSWGKPDFKFRNNTDFPIQIQAENKEDHVVVKILGTDTKDYYIKMEYELANVSPNEVYTEYPEDSGYYDGQVVSQGTMGHYVKTYRCKYSKKTDVLISREFEARSSYMSRPRVIAVVTPSATDAEPLPPETTPSEPVPTEPKPSETTPSEPVPTDPKPSETTPPTLPPETVPPETPPPAPPETTAPAEPPAPEA